MAKMMYMDNFGAIGVAADQPRVVTEHMIDAQDSANIASSLDDTTDDFNDVLGFRLDLRTSTWDLSAKKFWQLKGCLDYLIGNHSVTIASLDIERLLGTAISVLLLRRDLLCI